MKLGILLFAILVWFLYPRKYRFGTLIKAALLLMVLVSLLSTIRL